MQNRPPFQLTPRILNLATAIQELLGELKSYKLIKPSLKLRRANKIRTIHHSLAIEGNSLDQTQITAILENKRVVGPQSHILEVKNALKLYEELPAYKATDEKSLLKAHKILMQGLVEKPGQYRTKQVGVFNGTQIAHMAPPAKQVPLLMKHLFDFLKNDSETSWLLKACIFHYELEFIHPFEDGNGRMGRLWQQLLLSKHSPLFELVSTESLIHQKQREYYQVLERCDKLGESTPFIEFSLNNILICLQEFYRDFRPQPISSQQRINLAIEHFGSKNFTRKEYLQLHKDLSTASASRDLAEAVKQRLLTKSGDKALTVYRKNKVTQKP